MYLYTTHITSSHGGLQFLLLSEIERQPMNNLFKVPTPIIRYFIIPLFHYSIIRVVLHTVRSDASCTKYVIYACAFVEQTK